MILGPKLPPVGMTTLSLFLAVSSVGAARALPPREAAAAGYTLHTFHSRFERRQVDAADSRRPGFQWYLGQFFGAPPSPSRTVAFDHDGAVTLDGATDSGSSINSASPGKSGWVGTAFGGGGYFEATLRFNPEDVIREKGKNGWPAWWSMALEHMAQLTTEQWPGQVTGYAHFIEADFFEYDIWSFSPHQWYGGAMHDWYGIWKKSCPDGFCNVSNAPGGGTNFANFQVHTPAETDFTKYHRYGLLWIPASASSDGLAAYYFDGKPTNDRVTWSQYDAQSPPPGTAPWTFGIMDAQHLVLVLGTGVRQPMTVKSVDVWQRSAAKNLVH